MNKKILIGTTLAVIIVLASFSSIASAQSTKSVDSKISIFQNIIQNRLDDVLQPGEILNAILYLIILIVILLSGGNWNPF